MVSPVTSEKVSLTHFPGLPQLTYTPQCPHPRTAHMAQDDVGHVFLLPGKHIWHISTRTNHMVGLNHWFKHGDTQTYLWICTGGNKGTTQWPDCIQKRRFVDRVNSQLKSEYPRACPLYSVLHPARVLPRVTPFQRLSSVSSLSKGSFTMFGLLAISNRANTWGKTHLLCSMTCW